MPAHAPVPDRARTGRRGRLLRATAVVALLVVLAAVVALRGRDRFVGRVEESGKPIHVAYPGERLDLVLEDRERAGTPYEVTYRQARLVRRYRGRTGAKGRPSRITMPNPGRFKRATVTWRVNGRTIARWSVGVRQPDEPVPADRGPA